MDLNDFLESDLKFLWWFFNFYANFKVWGLLGSTKTLYLSPEWFLIPNLFHTLTISWVIQCLLW